jgi:low temperature requirement protein LtrA
VLNFRPLALGGISSIVLGVATIFVPEHIQLLLIAVAMLVSYVIPGYLLNAHSRVAA